MSRQVHADPGELSEFAAHLNDFGTKMRGEISSLRAHFDRLDWQDSQRELFAAEVEEMAGRLSAFLNTTGEIARKVRRKTEPLNEYLNPTIQ